MAKEKETPKKKEKEQAKSKEERKKARKDKSKKKIAQAERKRKKQEEEKKFQKKLFSSSGSDTGETDSVDSSDEIVTIVDGFELDKLETGEKFPDGYGK